MICHNCLYYAYIAAYCCTLSTNKIIIIIIIIKIQCDEKCTEPLAGLKLAIR